MVNSSNETIEDFESIDIETFKEHTGTYLVKEANLKLTIVFEDNKMYLVSEDGIKNELTQKSDISLYDPK